MRQESEKKKKSINKRVKDISNKKNSFSPEEVERVKQNIINNEEIPSRQKKRLLKDMEGPNLSRVMRLHASIYKEDGWSSVKLANAWENIQKEVPNSWKTLELPEKKKWTSIAQVANDNVVTQPIDMSTQVIPQDQLNDKLKKDRAQTPEERRQIHDQILQEKWEERAQENADRRKKKRLTPQMGKAMEYVKNLQKKESPDYPQTESPEYQAIF